MALNMIKLSVGAESLDDLAQWQAERAADRRRLGQDPRPRHTTRMWPKRAEEILDGGSLYWVIRGAVLARQRIEDLQEVIREDGIRRCDLVLSPEIIQVEARAKRPFQGWRYLTVEDAPPDVRAGRAGDMTLPPALAIALDTLGVVAR
ncbi:MAG: DUF1489 domain-containing protein [Pseudomonadota bacterium]